MVNFGHSEKTKKIETIFHFSSMLTSEYLNITDYTEIMNFYCFVVGLPVCSTVFFIILQKKVGWQRNVVYQAWLGLYLFFDPSCLLLCLHSTYFYFSQNITSLLWEVKMFTSFSVYFLLFPYPKNFSKFFPHTGKNRNRLKSNLLP